MSKDVRSGIRVSCILALVSGSLLANNSQFDMVLMPDIECLLYRTPAWESPFVGYLKVQVDVSYIVAIFVNILQQMMLTLVLSPSFLQSSIAKKSAYFGKNIRSHRDMELISN